MSEIMIIECFECQSMVSANILFEKKYEQEEYFQQEISFRLDNTNDYIDSSYELDSSERSSLPIEDDFKDKFLFKAPYILYLSDALFVIILYLHYLILSLDLLERNSLGMRHR